MNRTNVRARRKPPQVILLLLVAATIVGACGPKSAPITELSPEDLWTRGTAAYIEEDWADAIRYFDRFIIVGGSDPRVEQARYNVAQAHFNRGEYVTAASSFARLATDLGRADAAAGARFMACRSYQELSPDPQLDQEYTRAAIDHCQSLLDIFPGSDFQAQAETIVEEMWSKLAAKVYETAEWYRGRRAYDSAILYYEDVVTSYPQTEWAPRALGRLVEVYGVLEWEEEATEVRERLLREYPESAPARALSDG